MKKPIVNSTADSTPDLKLKAISFLQLNGFQLAFGPALAALLGSLYFSEIAGFVPCTLCWYQRILMYPLSVIILVGVFSDDRLLPRYILPLSITGLLFSTYHYLLQIGMVGNSTGCTIGAPCTARYINYFGFVTIPFLALIAFAMITALMIITRWANTQDVGSTELGYT